MSKVVTIAKLEALLSRIRTRAAEPRSARSAVAAAPAPVAPAPVAVVAAPAAPAPVAAPAPTPVAVAPAPPLAAVAPPAFVSARAVPAAPAPSPEPPEAIEETTLPPPPLVEVSSESDFDVDVDVSMTTPEPLTASEAAELQAGEAEASEFEAPLRDSRERLAAASPVAPEPARADGPTLERVEVLSDEEGVAAEDEEEEVEEAPASSRRPVAPPPEERLAELAFGTEEPQPARHTPPPKSGRLPAPPAGEFDPDVTGVRAATPGLSLEDEGPASAQTAEPSVLSAQAVRADLASGADVRVPDVLGQAQAFAPATFLALLDASLSL